MDTDERFMTVEEVRQLLRLSRKTVYTLLENGIIPGQKIGRDWRIDREKLEKKLAEG